MSEIVLKGVTKRFRDGTEAVKDVTFTIGDGELFVLLGPSGCGKSTLLSMIVGLEDMTEGEIRVDGQAVNDVDPKDRNMAMVFQSYALYPHMTVRQNLAFPLRLARVSPEEIERRVLRVAETLQLTELFDRKPDQLSGGQRQRVAMGRAIVREPVAFLMDEPLSNLDAKLRAQMRIEIARLQMRLRTTMVYVTHDQTEAMTLGDRVAVLRSGVLQQVGSPREIYEAPANLFVAGFVGSPPMNFLRAEIAGNRLILPMTELELPSERRIDLPEGKKRLLAGVRPEHFVEPSLTSRHAGGAFRAKAEVVEWLGSDVYAYFDVGAGESRGFRDLAEAAEIESAGPDVGHVVARLSPATRAAEGKEIELALDARNVHLFEPETGKRLALLADEA